MARLLLTRLLLAAALGALALAGAPGHAVSSTASGDQWVWPMPPNYQTDEPSFFDARRNLLTFLEGRSRVALWTLTADTPRTWAFAAVGGSLAPDLTRNNWVYDPAGDRIFMLDGLFTPLDSCCHYTYLSSIESLGLGTSPQLARFPVRGAVPVLRNNPLFTYDSRRHRVLVIGGTPRDSNDVLSTRVDAFDVSADSGSWSGFDVTDPPLPVQRAVALYDSLNDQVLVLGGTDLARTVGRWSIYSLDLSAPTGWQSWSLADSVPLPDDAFAARIFLDAQRRRLLLVNRPPLVFLDAKGGRPGAESSPASTSSAFDSTQVWSLDIDTRVGWTPIAYPGVTPGIELGQMCFDPGRDRLSAYGRNNRNDLAEIELDPVSPWTFTRYSEYVPSPSDAHAFFDAGGRRMIVVSSGYSGVWTVQRGDYDAWHQFQSSYGNEPRERDYAAVVYDSLTRRGFEFGGDLLDAELGDLWQFTFVDSDHVAWQRLFPEGDVPTPRWGAATILDPVRRRMIVYGGYAGQPLGDTWELTLDPPVRWRRLPNRGLPPPARSRASAVYDSRRDGMIVYGGDLGTRWAPQLTDDTWELSFADGDVWTPISPIGRPPTPRSDHGAVYDPRRDRMIVFWGRGYNAGRSDCMELDLAVGPTWQSYAPAGAGVTGAQRLGFIYDPVRDEALGIGGGGVSANGYSLPGIGVDFSANAVQSPPPLVGPPIALLGFAPNPTRDFENIAFDLPVDAEVHAQLYSAAGRLMRDLGPRRYVAGRHLLLWDGKNAHGESPPSGVYFVRLSMLGREFAGKFVYLR